MASLFDAPRSAGLEPGAGAPTDLAGDRPRERLMRLGPHALSDAELLALLLRTAPGGGARALADALLRGLGGLRALRHCTVAELARRPGLGPAKSASLVAAVELARRLAHQPLRPGDRIGSPADVHAHFRERLADERREHFMVLLLDGRHRVMGEAQVSQGTLTASLVHPREVFRVAVREAAAALVLVHNHPSGDPTPSSEDRSVTRRLMEAGELLGIRVVDHVVVAAEGFCSFSEAGLLE